QYGSVLPQIKTVRLEENIAEKIARLNRTTTARDMYDLAWIANTPAISKSLDLALIRRLAVLKIWVDTNGMHAGSMAWSPGHEGSTFDAEHWLRVRDKNEFDLEDIGALTVPAPSTSELCDTVRFGFAFLADMDSDEQTLAESNERDRSLAIRLLQNLPDDRLANIGLY
ncbi:MAG: nucleotidyl transferase AbiEii/AbiGii toxin family protein, partial [Coriobacteriia bacterium]|nr:nucleotidyl transferase AbiEii/AbiGii toxin family protein [Coriobacteriia bacterium]